MITVKQGIRVEKQAPYKEDSDYIINVKGLHKYFRNNHVLKGIDFQVQPGELISIIGRSGCGKTTLLRCLNCLEVFDTGIVRIAGITLNRTTEASRNEVLQKHFSKRLKDKMSLPFINVAKVENLDEDFQLKMLTLRRRVGMLFQSLNLFPHLTVLENVIKSPIIVKGETKEQATAEALQILEKVGLEDFIHRYPYQLSGGQAQRVAIARALALSPQVMLYDEPTSALDPELVGEVLSVMKNLHKEGMTQIVVTHAMHFAKTASDYIIYMEDGKIVEKSTPNELFSNAKDERTRQYLNIFKD